MSSEIGTYYILYDFGSVFLLIKLGYSKLIFDVAISQGIDISRIEDDEEKKLSMEFCNVIMR